MFNAELQESDLVDYQAREALTDADNSQESQFKENSDDDGHEMDLQQGMDNPLRGSANRTESQTSEDTDEMDLQHHMMQIFVKIHRSNFRKKRKIHCLKTITIEVMRSDTIFDVKDKIQDKEGIPAGKQILIFGSKLLVGSCTLKDYNIEEESTLTLELVPREIHIFAKTMIGKIMTFEVDREDSIYSVKEKIFDETRVPPGRQRLIYAGKELEDGRTLAGYDVHDGSTLYIVVRYPKCPGGGMHVMVTALNDKIITTEVEGEDSIYSLKVKVFNATGVPPDRQRLIFARKQLEDGRTLADYDVLNGSTIYLALRRIHIVVRMVTGEKIIDHAFMHPLTIDDIKAWVYTEAGILPEQQQLSEHGGAPLGEVICGPCTLVLRIRPPGGQ